VFEAMFYEADAAAIPSYYTDAATLVADGIPLTVGKANIEAFWQATCARAKMVAMKRSIAVERIEAASELSYALCTLTLHFTLPSGQAVTKIIKDITIWRRQPNGAWLIEVDISNPEP
jgi:ketosteroid isomerase-like protein